MNLIDTNIKPDPFNPQRGDVYESGSPFPQRIVVEDPPTSQDCRIRYRVDGGADSNLTTLGQFHLHLAGLGQIQAVGRVRENAPASPNEISGVTARGLQDESVAVLCKVDAALALGGPLGRDTLAAVESLREALGVPAGKPLLPYAHHAAKGMQALAILGWQDGHPVEWATKRAAAEAELRGAFAEAELVGTDHAAMVRQLWGNLRRMSDLYKSAAGDESKPPPGYRVEADSLGIWGWEGGGGCFDSVVGEGDARASAWEGRRRL